MTNIREYLPTFEQSARLMDNQSNPQLVDSKAPTVSGWYTANYRLYELWEFKRIGYRL